MANGTQINKKHNLTKMRYGHLLILLALLGSCLAAEVVAMTCFEDTFVEDTCEGQNLEDCKFSPSQVVYEGNSRYEKKLS